MFHFSVNDSIAAYTHPIRNLGSQPTHKAAFVYRCVRMRNAVNEFKGEIIQIVNDILNAVIHIIFNGDTV